MKYSVILVMMLCMTAFAHAKKDRRLLKERVKLGGVNNHAVNRCDTKTSSADNGAINSMGSTCSSFADGAFYDYIMNWDLAQRCGADHLDVTQEMVDATDSPYTAPFEVTTMCCECGGGTCNDGSDADVCGVCGGDGTTCDDPCGVPLGDGSTCADICGVPNGDNSTCDVDVCGVRDGNGTTCDDRCGIPAGNDACVAAIEAAHDTSAIEAAAVAAATPGIESAAVAAATPGIESAAVTAYKDSLDVCGVENGDGSSCADGVGCTTSQHFDNGACADDTAYAECHEIVSENKAYEDMTLEECQQVLDSDAFIGDTSITWRTSVRDSGAAAYAKGCSYEIRTRNGIAAGTFYHNADPDAVVGSAAANACGAAGIVDGSNSEIVRYCELTATLTSVSAKAGLTFTAGSNAADDSTCMEDASGLTAAAAAAVAAYKGSAEFNTDYLATLDACGVHGGSITDVADCPSASIDLTSDGDCQTAKDYFNAQCNCADYS